MQSPVVALDDPLRATQNLSPAVRYRDAPHDADPQETLDHSIFTIAMDSSSSINAYASTQSPIRPADVACHIHLRDLSAEILHIIFDLLATDSLENISLTCHRASSIESQLRMWTTPIATGRTLEGAYTSTSEWEQAVRTTVAIPPFFEFGGNS
ncbi:hypothetical protein M427DRAFT_33331 [Gonapodya prolifera JEL478]|uniref:F-box domain-containing protein n=1 Tax=Gonapodya prolifera (strain JEL478) TaxID=1344416 RepID=A0A139ACI1_GONPJ|nr:hypothetical protein M427DRAFT_33331 [Gonapodya prolifera JEL478]|eukprot:KXS14123.1 hypothetical protein M427DRAFT_33331 [Gonapodya prolifera JEL478]